MKLISCQLRQDVLTAVEEACAYLRLKHNVLVEHEPTTSLDEFRALFPAADVAALDLKTLDTGALLTTLTEALEEAPFVTSIVVPHAISSVQRPQDLIALGRIGADCPPSEGHALHTTWWVQTVWTCAGMEIISSAWDLLRDTTTEPNRQALVTQVADHYSTPSVKGLSKRLYRTDSCCVATKRRRLYERCKAVGVSSPEALLHGIRLLLLKVVLDGRCWSYDTIAGRFGFDDARALSRYTKSRFGVPASALQEVPMDLVMKRVDEVLNYGGQVDRLMLEAAKTESC